MKKAITIISLSLVGILILTTIILACITVRADINYGDPTRLTIYDDDLGVKKVNRDDKADKIVSMLKRGTEQKLLPAIFDNTIDNIEVTTYETSRYEGSARENNSESTVKFELQYAQKTTLKADGKSFDVYSLMVVIGENKGRSTITIYGISEDTTATSVAYKTKISITGDFSDIYTTINGYVEEVL